MGVSDWFADLYQGSYRSLVLTAYAMTNDIGSAEEITQEAFALAYGRQARVARADSPEAWLRTVVVNLARRRGRRRAMLDRILRRHQPEPAVAPPGEHLDLHAAIRGLGAAYRAVVVLHYLADLPVDTVASIFGHSSWGGEVPAVPSPGRACRAAAYGGGPWLTWIPS